MAIWSVYGLLWGTMMQFALPFMRWLINFLWLPSVSAKKGRHISRPEDEGAPRSRTPGNQARKEPKEGTKRRGTLNTRPHRKPTRHRGPERAAKQRNARTQRGTIGQRTDRQREARRPAATNHQPGALEQNPKTRRETRQEKEQEQTQQTPPKEDSRGARVALSKTGISFLTALSRCQVLLPSSRRRRERLTARAGQTEKTARAQALRERPGRNRARAQTLGSPPHGGADGRSGRGGAPGYPRGQGKHQTAAGIIQNLGFASAGRSHLFFFKPNGAKRNINFVPFGRSNSGGGERGAARPAPASAPRAMQQGKRRGGPTRSRSSTAERERAAGAIDRSFVPSRAREGRFPYLDTRQYLLSLCFT